jgi:hypothetical protein
MRRMWAQLVSLARRLGTIVLEVRTTVPLTPPAGFVTLYRDQSSGALRMGLSDGTSVAVGSGGGVSAHTALTALAWTSSGHTGTASRLAGFDGAGAASYTQIGASGGVQSWDTDLDGYAALSSTGLVARTGSGTAAARAVTAGSAQLTVVNGSGVAGNPTIDLAYASAVRETSGPTTLALGAVLDGQLLRRSGATMIGAWVALALVVSPDGCLVDLEGLSVAYPTTISSAGTVV